MTLKYSKVDDDGRSAFYAKAAAIDVQRRNKDNVGSWSVAQCEAAADMQRQMHNAYSPTEVYVSYRKNFIAVKASNPAPCMTQNAAIAKLEAYCAAQEIEMVATAGALIFRMFKKK